MGSFCVTRSEEVDPTSAITIEDTRRSLITGTGVESGKNAREVVTVNLTREDGGGTKGEPAGTVKLSVVFRPPRYGSRLGRYYMRRLCWYTKVNSSSGLV